jgi:UDP-glucose 4-epimerase
VADLLVKALERGGTGPYNAGTGIGTSVNELFATLDALTGYGLKPERLPPRPGDLRRISLDSARARRDLDWAPAVDFKEGLRRTVEWFRRQQPA